MSHVSPVGSAPHLFHASCASSAGGASRTQPPSSNRATAASRLVWDRLSEQERLEHLESMDPDAVRAMAASMPVIEQAKGILMGCYGDAAAAFSIQVRLSSVKNVKLRELAAVVVDAASRQDRAAEETFTSPSERVRRLLQVEVPPLQSVREHRS